MPVKRGTDGVPVDVPSVVNQGKTSGQAPQGHASLFGSDDSTFAPGAKSAGLFPQAEPPTVPAVGSKAEAQVGKAEEEPRTVIAGGLSPRAAPQQAAVSHQLNPMTDPVVGWLVIVDGPGKGAFVKLGNGQNSIGRAANQRVCLDFGDEQISRNSHAVLSYDPRGRKFYIQQGSGTNLTYLDAGPVLAPTELSPRSRIMLGNTTVLFIPFCDEHFHWGMN